MTEYKRVGELFDRGAADYDRLRRQLIPCFDDFYGTALSLVRQCVEDAQVNAPVVVDLGAGSGLLSGMLLDVMPNGRMTLVDLSEEMLTKARERFAGNAQVEYHVADYTAPNLVKPGSLHVVVSALSIHHLSDGDKRRVYQSAYDWLRPGGILVNADQVLGATAALERQYRDEWLRRVTEAGVGQDHLDEALERMKADRMAPLVDQLDWLREAGFAEVDCAYKNFNFVVLWGGKAI